MKTTLDLPDDVALTLRLESARRGGRRAASYSKLVADAIRQVYAGEAQATCKIQMKKGRAVVSNPDKKKRVTSEDVRNALDDI